MNHDATHCFNCSDACPKSCYRAQLTRELELIRYELPTSWASFKYSKECPKWPSKIPNQEDGHEQNRLCQKKRNIRKGS